MASVTATSNGMAAVSSTVADPPSGRRRPAADRAGIDAATTSADPEQGAHMIEDAVQEVGHGAVAGPGQGEGGDRGRYGSYQT